MAYDMNRCPQTEAEASDYIFTLYQRTIGQPANDWAAVMQNSNLPHNVYTPGLQGRRHLADVRLHADVVERAAGPHLPADRRRPTRTATTPGRSR